MLMDKQDQILDAAARRFALYGFRRTVLDDIARDAGIGKGSIYLHVPGKDELFIQTVRREQRLMIEAAREATAGLSPRAAIQALVLRMLKWLDERPLMGRLMTGDPELGMGPDLGRQAEQACHDERLLYDHISELLARGAEEGIFRGDLSPEAAVTLIISIFHIYLHNKRQHFIELDDEVFVAELLRILFEGILICERGTHAA